MVSKIIESFFAVPEWIVFIYCLTILVLCILLILSDHKEEIDTDTKEGLAVSFGCLAALTLVVFLFAPRSSVREILTIVAVLVSAVLLGSGFRPAVLAQFIPGSALRKTARGRISAATFYVSGLLLIVGVIAYPGIFVGVP